MLAPRAERRVDHPSVISIGPDVVSERLSLRVAAGAFSPIVTPEQRRGSSIPLRRVENSPTLKQECNRKLDSQIVAEALKRLFSFGGSRLKMGEGAGRKRKRFCGFDER